jgi:hypothetical protein
VREELEVDVLRAEKVRLLSLHEDAQIIEDPLHPLELLPYERDRLAPFLGFVAEQLELPATDRDWVAKRVARVLDQLPLAARGP